MRNNNINKIIKSNIRFALLAATMLSTNLVFAAERIDKITILGNKRIETPTIESYLGLKIGDEYSSSKENSAIKSLYDTSLFENISIKFSHGTLLVNVVETPFISKVECRGNSKLKSTVLLKELLTKPGDSLSSGKIQADIEKVKEIYKRSGRFSIQIEPKIERQDNNRVKVIFAISEGPKTGIKHIYFVGNEYYRSSELKQVLLTKESRWFRFLESNDTYDPDRIEYDKELLKRFYQSLGFADFNVISATAELNKTKEYFTVTYSIEEGEKYSFGTIEVDNKILNIDEAEVKKLINIKPGQVFNMKLLEQIAEKITANLASRGYPQVNVHPDIDKKAVERVANIKFVIDKADRILVGKINIEGNLKTEDRVIRREFKIAEGDIFNRSHIEKGERNLRNLDYFETVSTKVTPTSKHDRYDININVEEKSTSSIGFDLGYSTASKGMFGRLSFLERNLIGTGKYFTFGVQGAKKSTSYYAGITEPRFLDRDLSLSGNAFKNHSGRGGGFSDGDQNYTLKAIGFKTSLGYEICEDLTHDIDYLIKREDLNASDTSSSRYLIEQKGKFTTSAVGHTLTYDRTDSRIIPKNGYIISGSQEYAGVGGNNKYLKHEVDAKYFKSFFNNKLTYKLAGSAGDIRGVGGKTVRISDRYNLGDYSFRGFAAGGIGPRDKKTEEGLGGEKYYTVTNEFNFPLGLPEEFNVSGAIFSDVGSLWGVSLSPTSTYKRSEFYNDKFVRASVGCGVIWITRFAPIRMDWAIAIKKKKYDDKQRFHLKFSTSF